MLETLISPALNHGQIIMTEKIIKETADLNTINQIDITDIHRTLQHKEHPCNTFSNKDLRKKENTLSATANTTSQTYTEHFLD